jgi:hypothetical protein
MAGSRTVAGLKAGLIGVVFMSVVVGAAGSGQGATGSIDIADVTNASRVTCFGLFKTKSVDGAAPVIKGRLVDGSKSFDQPVSVKAGAIMAEWQFTTTIDFSRFVKAGETKTFKLELQSNRAGDFMKIDRR